MWITSLFGPITIGLYSHTLAQKASRVEVPFPPSIGTKRRLVSLPLIFDEIAAPAALAGLVKDTVFDHGNEFSLKSFFTTRNE